jgi:hypothetical protein
MDLVKMKGQIFILASVMILLAIFMLRSATKTTDVKQSDTFYQSFSNLKGELTNTVGLALMNHEDVSSELGDFIEFSKEVYAAKGYKESVNYTVLPGPTTTVYINVSLASSDSYLLENLIVNRTVYS